MGLKRWALVLTAVVAVMATGRYLFGYHFSSIAASSVKGEVLAQQDYPGGRALLVDGPGGCSVVLTRKTGLLWQEFGVSACGFEKPSHPFSWAGHGNCVTGAK